MARFTLAAAFFAIAEQCRRTRNWRPYSWPSGEGAVEIGAGLHIDAEFRAPTPQGK